jgi:quercetin dioxygenase-like cupin family protein
MSNREEPTRENPCGTIGTRIIFENDLVRVWDMQVGPRGRKPWHHHKLPYVIIPISGGRVEIENVEGKVYYGEEKGGEAIWRDAGEKHELRNLTDAPYQNVLVEIKQPAKP